MSSLNRSPQRKTSNLRGPSRSVAPRDEVLDFAMLKDFTTKEIGEMKEAFDLFDKQGKGIIDMRNMIKYLKDLKVDSSYPTVFKLVEKLCTEFPRGISFKEFMEHIQFYFGDIETGEGLQRFFELLDYNQNDVLEVHDLERVAREIGENITREEIEELIEYDFESTTGSINTDQFYLMMSKTTF